MNNNPLEKSTCDNFPVELIIPVPARVIAELTKVSESYVKKLRAEARPDNSETAQRVTKAENLLKGAMAVAVDQVNQVINK